MLEMEADMPLSNAQLYAEMKKEMKGAGGAQQGLCSFFLWETAFRHWGSLGNHTETIWKGCPEFSGI